MPESAEQAGIFAGLVGLHGVGIGIGSAQDLKPKLGPDAITVQQSHAYLRGHDAPDYWALSPYYVPQATDSACSVAAATRCC